MDKIVNNVFLLEYEVIALTDNKCNGVYLMHAQNNKL